MCEYRRSVRRLQGSRVKDQEPPPPDYATVIIESSSQNSNRGDYFFYTVCPGSSHPPEKIFNIFASENEVYTIY